MGSRFFTMIGIVVPASADPMAIYPSALPRFSLNQCAMTELLHVKSPPQPILSHEKNQFIYHETSVQDSRRPWYLDWEETANILCIELWEMWRWQAGDQRSWTVHGNSQDQKDVRRSAQGRRRRSTVINELTRNCWHDLAPEPVSNQSKNYIRLHKSVNVEQD